MNTIAKSENTKENIATLEASIGETDIGKCILWVLDDGHDNTNAYRIARDAAAELAAKDEQIAQAERIIRELAARLTRLEQVK